MNSKPLISVIVITYNQEQYIRQALDSIMAQETDYPFEVIIGEDYGPDGTRAICEEYAQKYGMLTHGDYNGQTSWQWTEGPWPWEYKEG